MVLVNVDHAVFRSFAILDSICAVFPGMLAVAPVGRKPFVTAQVFLTLIKASEFITMAHLIALVRHIAPRLLIFAATIQRRKNAVTSGAVTLSVYQ